MPVMINLRAKSTSNLTALLETHYLPSIAYFCALHAAGSVVLERHEYYVKQTYRNRCYINTTHGRDSLIIPLTAKHGKVHVKDVRIDYGQKWLNNHWRTIRSAYGNAPFYEHYAPDLEQVLFNRYEFLYDLNFNLLTLCLRWLRWDLAVNESLSYDKIPGGDIWDLRSFITPKNPTNLKYIYQAVPYHQVFGNAFADNLSLIDLIFCNGPEAGRIIQASTVKH